MTQSLSAEEIAELLAYFGHHGELPHGVEEALLGMASKLLELEAQLYALDKAAAVLVTSDGLRFAPDGESVEIAAGHVGWPGPTSRAKGG